MIDFETARQEIINKFKIPKGLWKNPITGNPLSADELKAQHDLLNGTWPVYRIETEDVEYEDVTHKRLEP